MDEFMSHMTDPAFADFFALRGLNLSSAQQFFSFLIKAYGTDKLKYETFISACLKLRGEASKLDLQLVSFQTQLMQTSAHHFHVYVRERFAHISKSLKEVSSAIQAHNL